MKKCPSRIELGDGYVGTSPCKIHLEGTGGNRIAYTEDIPSRVQVPILVVCGCIAPIIGSGARIGRKNQHRVDHQRTGGVVAAHLESEAPFVHLVPARHGFGQPIFIHLIGVWL